MSDLDFELPENLDILRQELRHPSSGGVLLEAGLSRSHMDKVGEIQFGLDLGSQLRVEAFNSGTTKDSLGILQAPTDKEREEGQLPSQLAFDSDHVWLKYSLISSIRPKVGATLGDLGLSLRGEKKALLVSYRAHLPSTPAWQALQADGKSLRRATRWADVEDLAPREALAYQVFAKVKTSLKLTLADLFTTNLSSLAKLVKTDTALTVKVTAGATAGFAITFSDVFLVVFSRGDGTKIRVAIKKGEVDDRTFTGNLGITAEFAEADDLQRMLEAAVEGIFGAAMDKIDALMSKLDTSQLSPTEKRLLNRVKSRFPASSEALSETQAVVEAWNELRKELRTRIEALAKAKVKAGFSYEYQRVAEDETLLQACLPSSTASRFHASLIRGDLGDLLAHLATNEEALENYLHLESLVRRRAYGFSLGLGKWSISNEDESLLRSIQRQDLEGRRQLSYQGARSYSEKWFRHKADWAVDLKADMPELCGPPPANPTSDQFRFGLTFQWTWSTPRLRKNALGAFTDLGILWQGMSENDLEDLIQGVFAVLDEAPKKKRGAKVEVGIRFDHDDLLSALGGLSKLSPSSLRSALAEALAGAMPYHRRYRALALARRRRRLYAPVWERYLAFSATERRARTRDYWGSMVEGMLRPQPKGRYMAPIERSWAKDSDTEWGWVALAHRHPNLARDWSKFLKGMARLTITEGEPQIEEAYNEMRHFWSQALYVRALGILLLDQVADASRITRTFRIRLEAEDEERIMFGTPLAR